jgi:hypothetical protein
MKNFLLTLSLAGLLVFGLSSCSKDKDDNSSLARTTWVKYYPDFTTISIHFRTYAIVEIVETDRDGWDRYSTSGTYTYSEPNVTITISEDGDTYRITGIVNGDTLTLYSYEGGELGGFQKQ